MEPKSEAKHRKTIEQILSEHLKQKPIWIGDSLRFSRCPICQKIHESNPAFAIDLSKRSYFAHCCNDSGSIDDLLEGEFDFTDILWSSGSTQPKIKSKITPELVYKSKYVLAEKNSRTANYLRSRGIKYNSWSDLQFPLKESQNPYNGYYSVAVYPFIDRASNIIATQSVRVDSGTLNKADKRYYGPKGSGIAILQQSKRIIVAEGLENGLSVRQHLGNDYGLIICGDAGNLKKLATDHAWAIESCKKIVVAVDNDEHHRTSPSFQ